MSELSSAASERPRVAVSACLLGEQVRYDGDHKRHSFVADLLAPHVEIEPICPEIELGMGVPREPIELVREAEGVRLRGVKNGVDHTDAMQSWATERLAPLIERGIDGFVLKRGSPSCGFDFVKVRNADKSIERRGTGVFAAAVREAFPLTPAVNEDGLETAAQQFPFLWRVFASFRLRNFFSVERSAIAVVEFHSREKMLMRATDERLYHELGTMTANLKPYNFAAFAARYQPVFQQAIAITATAGSWRNSLQHAAGYLSSDLSPEERSALHEQILALDPAATSPASLLIWLHDLATRFDQAYLLAQTLLEPFPRAILSLLAKQEQGGDR